MAVAKTDTNLSNEIKHRLGKRRSQLQEVWRRLRRNKMALIGMTYICLIVVIALSANLLVPYEKIIANNTSQRLQSPSSAHWFGTDEFGRDLMGRMIHGARMSLLAGVVSTSLSILMGGSLGALAGFYGGRLDNVIMRGLDILYAIPSILLAIAIVTALGTSIVNLMIAISISAVPGYARTVRASVMQVKDMEFVEAARAVGASDARIIFSHIIPNVLAPVIVRATLGIASAVISTASLSFLGLGIQPPAPEWGNILSGGREYLRVAPHIVTIPGLAIVSIVLAFNFFGDGLRDALDPKLKR